jgi:DNA primase
VFLDYNQNAKDRTMCFASASSRHTENGNTGLRNGTDEAVGSKKVNRSSHVVWICDSLP